jgi:hypothetical protein
LGFELDTLYHRMGYVSNLTFFSTEGVLSTSTIDVKGSSWDFPLMAKYQFRRVSRLYLAGGGVLRYVGPVRGRGENLVQDFITRVTSRTPVDTAEPFELRKRFYPGLTAATGVEFGIWKLRVAP